MPTRDERITTRRYRAGFAAICRQHDNAAERLPFMVGSDKSHHESCNPYTLAEILVLAQVGTPVAS